jgi:hypothetical protein
MLTSHSALHSNRSSLGAPDLTPDKKFRSLQNPKLRRRHYSAAESYFVVILSDITYAVACHISASDNTSRHAGMRKLPRCCPSAMASKTDFGRSARDWSD